MTIKAKTNEVVKQYEQTPDQLFNTLVKLPGVEFNHQTIADFVNLYLNAHLILPVSGVLKPMDFKVNYTIIGANNTTVTGNTKLGYDRTLADCGDMIRCISRSNPAEALKNSLIILNFFTINQYENKELNTANFKYHFSPFIIEPNRAKASYHNGFMLKIDTTSTSSFDDGNCVLSFTGNSNFNFDQVFNTSLKAPVKQLINNQLGIAKYMFNSPLFKRLVTYGENKELGLFIERYIKPKFLSKNFEFVLTLQEHFESPYFSTGCKEISEGIWITNPAGYEVMRKKDCIEQKFLGRTFEEHYKIEVDKIYPINTTATAAPAKTEAKMIALFDENGNINGVKGIDEVAKSKLIRITPPLIHLCTGIVIKDYITADKTSIKAGSNVTFKQSSINTISKFDPFIATFFDKVTKATTTEVMSAELINDYVALIARPMHSNMIHQYQEVYKTIYNDKLSLTPVDEANAIVELKEFLTEAHKINSFKELLTNNYVVELMKINGMKRYNVSLRALYLIIIHHIYYEKTLSSKLNIFGNLPVSQINKTLVEAIDNESSLNKIPAVIKVKMGNMVPKDYTVWD